VLCRVFCALLFVAWTAEWPLQFDTQLYNGLWRSPFQVLGPLFVSLPGINLFAWQVLLLVLAPLCLVWPGAFRKRSGTMDAAILISLASVALTFLWGWLRGGSAYNAYYQLWRFLTALLVATLLLSVIRTSRDLKALGATVLAAALVRGTLALYFYWAHVRGKMDPPPPHMTTHDDSLLFVAGLVISWSWAFMRGTRMAWLAAMLVSALLLCAITVNDRRLAWVELVLAFALMYVLLPSRGWRRRVNRWLLFMGPVLLAYVVAGQGRSEGFFAPVQALSTVGSDADASSLARQEEVRNLLYTLSTAWNPLLGTGWGVPYQKVTSFYANYGAEWWQYGYLPHNSLLGVTVFGGLVGISGIWLVVPAAAFLAMRGYRGSTRAVDCAAAMATVCILPAYSAQCYGDVGFQSLTCGLIFGVAMAVAGKVAAWAGAPSAGARRRAAAMSAAAPEASPAELVPEAP
jgi:hypothetical protein